MFEKFYGRAAELLADASQYRPFPTIEDRDAWEGLAQEQKDFFVSAAEEYLGYAWPAIPATAYLEFCRSGNRNYYTGLENRRRAALMILGIAECIENKGRFVDDLINGLWEVLNEASWVSCAHNEMYPPVDGMRPLPPTTRQEDIWVDHFAGDTGCLVAVLLHFLRPRLDAVTPQIAERTVYELNRRIVRPFMEHDDLPWMGTCPGRANFVNNWLPWVVSNCMMVIHLTQPDAGLRARALEKAMRLEDRYMQTIHPDGGCEEGTRYWGVAATALFAGLEILSGMTGGAVEAYDNETLMAYTSFIVKMHIEGHQYTTFEDADRWVHINMQGAWHVAKVMHNPELEQLALYMRAPRYSGEVRRDGMHFHAVPTFRELFSYKEYMEQPQAQAPRLRDGWFPGIQMMSARQTKGSSEGLFLAARGGTNGESHNHNDVGTFILYSDGCPAVIDMGAGDYTASSFIPEQRYVMNKNTTSAYHNLPLVNGVQQCFGLDYTAKAVEYAVEGDVTRFALNLENAYPQDGPILSWRRAYTMDRAAKSVVLQEQFALREETQDAALVLMTAEKPEWNGSVLRIPAENGRAVLAACTEGWIPETEAWDVSNNALFVRDWGGCVYRTLFRPERPVQSGTVTMTFTQEG